MNHAPIGNQNMKSRIFARIFFGQSPVSSQIRSFGGFSIVEFKGYFPFSRGHRFEEGIPLKASPRPSKTFVFGRTRRGARGDGDPTLKAIPEIEFAAASSGGSGVRVNGRKKAGAEGDRPVCNAVQNEKTGDTAPVWHRHWQTGPSKVENRPRAVDEVEDLIGGDAAGICGGGAVRWRSRPVRCGGGGGVWGNLPRRMGSGARSSHAGKSLSPAKVVMSAEQF
jgi:hypothetical protein